MRLDVPLKGRTTTFMLVTVIALAFLIFLSHIASAQVGVFNTPPAFTDITIEEVEDVIYVDVGIRDLNGWTSIFAVNVTVYDEQSRIINKVNFTLYNNLTSEVLFGQFNQDKRYGEHLNGDSSTFTYLEISPWNPDHADGPVGLNVRFAYNKFAGDSIEILCMDKAEIPLTCEYSGPFSAEFTPPPSFGDNVAIPISLSAVIASGGALFMIYKRMKTNQLARAVESKARGK